MGTSLVQVCKTKANLKAAGAVFEFKFAGVLFKVAIADRVDCSPL